MTKKKKTPKPLTLSETEGLLGSVYLVLELTVIPGLVAWAAEALGGLSEGAQNYLYYWINAVCCGWIFREMLKSSLISAGQNILRLFGAVVVGFLILLGSNELVTSLAERLIPGFVNSNNAAVADMVRINPVTMSLSLILLVPLAEECLFRGLFFVGLAGRNRGLAYLISVCAFCAIHVLGYVGTVDSLTLGICFVQYIPAGLVLAWSCEKTGSVCAPMLIHAAINAGSIHSLALR